MLHADFVLDRPAQGPDVANAVAKHKWPSRTVGTGTEWRTVMSSSAEQDPLDNENIFVLALLEPLRFSALCP